MIRKLTPTVIAACLALAAWYSWPRADRYSTDSMARPGKPRPDAGSPLVTWPQIRPPERVAVSAAASNNVASHSAAAEISAQSADAPASLVIRLDGLRPDGTLRLAVFDQPQGFPRQDKATRRFTVEAADATRELVIGDLPRGTLAVAVFQDLNRDGVLNQGAFGVPSEPYGFSNNARGAFGPPTFESAAFRILAEQQALEIHIR
jgi:uncharacterized protein (DUF2141 family)